MINTSGIIIYIMYAISIAQVSSLRELTNRILQSYNYTRPKYAHNGRRLHRDFRQINLYFAWDFIKICRYKK